MKRRVRVQPTNPFYSNEPAVSRSLIAGQSPIPNASLANAPNKIVDKKPGKMSGIAGFVSKSKPTVRPSGIVSPKLGMAAKVPTQGKLRSSGHSGAHRIGGKKI